MHRASGEPFYGHLGLLGCFHSLSRYKIIKRSGEFYTHLAPNDLCGEDTCKNGQVCVIILLLSIS